MRLSLLLSVLSFSLGDCRGAHAAVECSADFMPAQMEAMEQHFDANVPPCDDYYEYACGNWRASHQLRTLRAHDTLSAVRADNKRRLMEYFEEVAVPNRSSTATTPLERSERRHLAHFYNACVDEALKTEQMDVFIDELRKYSTWPLVDAHYREKDANESFNWPYVSAQMRRYGAQSLWRLLVQPNWQASEQQVFYITAPAFDQLLRPVSGASEEDATFLYQRYIKYLLLDLGVRVRNANKHAAEVVQFERGLQALAGNERTVVLKAPQTLKALDEQLPAVKLLVYFRTLLADFDVSAQQLQQLLIVADTDYLRKLGRYLRSAKTETIGVYLLVQFLAHHERHLHDDDAFTERKQHCLQQLNNLLPDELSALFLALQHGSSGAYLAATQVELSDLFERLKGQFAQLLNATNIFERDAVTKVLGLEKLRAMRLVLPQLPPEGDGTVSLAPNATYDEMLLQLMRQRARSEFAMLLTGRRPTAGGGYGPLDVNAYYRLKSNAIELPVGLLRTPFYDTCLSRPRLYGGLVFILAHELVHGFDYDGLNYDKSGNVANGWGVKAIIKFGTKSSCYVSERYEQAALTINENIADTEGLRLALQTLVAHEATPLTPDQLKLFFASFAQTWCGSSTSSTPHAVRLHAAHRERVNNVLGNFEEFAAAYQCQTHSAMNPSEKCRIW